MSALQIPVLIDRSSPVPLYHQLAEQMARAIDEGKLQPGDPFENEVSVAERLQLSRPTVRRAIQELVDRGLLILVCHRCSCHARWHANQPNG
jgi:GntR family transcriptional regulator